MSIGERIKHARKNAGLSQADLASQVGRSQSAVAEWETGETAPRRNIVEKIASSLGVSALWLEIGGANDQQRSFEPVQSAVPVSSANNRQKVVSPIFASVDDGHARQVEQRLQLKNIIEHRPKPGRWSQVKDLYGFYVATDSMVPRINPGELVWVHPHRQPQLGQEVVFLRRGEPDNVQKEIMVKVCAGQTATRWIAKQFNPNEEIELKKTDWECHLIVQIDLNR